MSLTIYSSLLPFLCLLVYCRDEVIEATALQRSRFEVARGKRQRAREAADLLLLSLYCHIPPRRGLEMRTLQVVHETELAGPFSPTDFRNRNIVLLQSSGGVVIYIQLFKTSKFVGPDSITIEVGSRNYIVLAFSQNVHVRFSVGMEIDNATRETFCPAR